MMELLPCPFCGKQPTIKHEFRKSEIDGRLVSSGEHFWSAECCIVKAGETWTEERMAKAWNTRTPAIKNEEK